MKEPKEKKLKERKSTPGKLSRPGKAAKPERKAQSGNISQAMLQAIMDNSAAVIFIKDKDGKYAFINRRYEEAFKVTGGGLIGKTNYDIFPREVADELRENDKKVIKANRPIEFEDRIPHPDGKMRTYLALKFPIPGMSGAIGCITTDITDRKRMEEELFKARKLESLGVLAGGIAHDFNNLLLGILGNVSVARTLVKPDDKVFDILDQVEKAAVKAKSLTRQILTFSRGGEPIRKATNIAGLLKDSASLVLKDSNVRCDFLLPEELWAADVDEGQIGHVFNNILINAMQSMPGGGVISIAAGNFILACDSPLPLKKGGYVRVAIKDAGCGIPEKDLGRIFDPFFTTKQKASGLGLALSYSIVKKHDGYICAESKPGKGAIFYVYLPAARKEAFERADSPEKPAAGRLRILVMDDEEFVRDVMEAMLGNLGYEASFATSGAEAVGLFREAKESGRPFDAVILDLTVPGVLGGKETMQKLLEIDPGVKGIVSSGYSRDPIMSDFRKYGFSAVMSKPFRVSDFGKVIKNVLAEGQ